MVQHLKGRIVAVVFVDLDLVIELARLDSCCMLLCFAPGRCAFDVMELFD